MLWVLFVDLMISRRKAVPFKRLIFVDILVGKRTTAMYHTDSLVSRLHFNQ